VRFGLQILLLIFSRDHLGIDGDLLIEKPVSSGAWMGHDLEGERLVVFDQVQAKHEGPEMAWLSGKEKSKRALTWQVDIL
jgi:hypothetical protein